MREGDYKPIWKQEYRSETGGKRLHGAFTGGFSAGYYNTVGSKDGWAPSQFKSSRTDRADAVDNRVEAYMDEEDHKVKVFSFNIFKCLAHRKYTTTPSYL